VAALINLAVMVALLLPALLGRRGPFSERVAPGEIADAIERRADDLVIVGGTGRETGSDGVPVGAYDRVVRIASWIFILVAATIVAVTGLWPDAQPAIFVLLALAGMIVLVVHDLLPLSSLGSGKFIVEGSVAITLAALLVVFTGQVASPFFFVFPLIVAGAALVVSPQVTVVLAGVASFAYLVAAFAGPTAVVSRESVATAAVNLTALLLLAYVAMVIAREQRRSRDEAIRLSTVDPLTGLFNRTFFFAAVDREIARSSRSGRGFCILMMDLDELKLINDRLGH
jgi:predicted signal transduction protein with EAL and GGDEF domain